MEQIMMRKHFVEGLTIIAASDISALGKKYKGEKAVLDLIRFRSFYEGKAISVQELKQALKDCDSANLVGKESVSAAMEEGHAKEGQAIDIGGVPHLQIFRIPPDEGSGKGI